MDNILRLNQKRSNANPESLSIVTEERAIKKKDSSTDSTIIDQREKYYDNIINDIKNNDYCLQSKDSIYKKKYERKYGFFCYSCTNEDMCEYCFYNCHKNCDEKLKIIAKLNEYIPTTKYYCSCKTNLFHSIRQANPLKEKIKNQLNKFDNVYCNIFKDEEADHYFSTKSHNLINSIIANLRNSSTLTKKNSKIIQQEKNMLYHFNQCFYDFLPEKDDYMEFFNIFILYQYIIGQQLVENYFGKFKPLITNDFIGGAYFDILWYKKLLKKKMIYHFENYHNNFFQPENSKERKYHGEILYNYVLSQFHLYLLIVTNITEKLCKFMSDNIQKSKVHLQEEDELKELIQIVCKNINLLAKYLLVNNENNIIIMNFLFMVNVHLTKCNKDTTEKNEKISYINGFPFLLSSLLYKCVQIYNLQIFEDFIKTGSSNRKYMFLDTHEEIKHKCFISFLKLIANKDNNPITFDKEKELEMFNDLFFNPFNKSIDHLNLELYCEFNFNELDETLIGEYYEINNDIHNYLEQLFLANGHDFYINKILYKTSNGGKLIDESEDENVDIRELEAIIKKLYDKIEILTLIKNPVRFLNEVKNFSKLRVFYNILYDELFIDEYDEILINEVVDYLIYNNIDYSIALVLSVLFNIIIKSEKVNDNQFLKKFENILNYSLNILTIITCNEKGLRAMSIGSSLQIISNIIFGSNVDNNSLEFALKMKKDIFFQKMYAKIYKFYSIIPLNLRKDYLKQIKPETIWTDPIINIITIYKGIIINDEFNHLNDSQNILELYYSFMQIHENYFNIKDCVSFIENNYNNKNNYNQIKLSDDNFKQSEIYFDLLELISYNHSMFAKSEEPSKNFLHLLKIEQFTELMKYKYLPINKKIILLKSMFLIIISPLKNYKLSFKREKINNIKKSLIPLLDKFLLVLINEVQKLEKKNEYNNEEKNYCIQIINSIWDFCNFIYSSNNLNDYLLKNYYILLLKLKIKEPILDLMLLNKKNQTDFNNENNFIDKEEYEIDNNSLNKIGFSYDIMYKNYYTFLLKYKTFIPSINNSNLFDEFFSILKSNVSYSKISIRYKFMFENNFSENTNCYNQTKYSVNLIQNINNWRNYTIDQINQTNNYLCSNIIQSNIQKKLNFEYLLEENLYFDLFNLLNVCGELSSIMILKIGYEVIYNISTDDLYNTQISENNENKDTKSSIYLENLISKLLNKLFFFLKAYISVSKIFPNTKIEKQICIRIIGFIKLFQYFLEGFNCTFIYYIFIKKYQLKIEQEDFDKEFKYGFPEKIDNSNYFINDNNSEKQEISEEVEELIKKNYHYRNPPTNNRIINYTRFTSFFQIGFPNIEAPKPLFLHLIPIFDLSMDTIHKLKNIKHDKVVAAPDSNYALIFSSLIDFFIECVSNFNVGTKKIFSNSFVFYTAEYSKYDSGIFGIFSNMSEKNANTYLNSKIFRKIRILDLVCSLMDHKYFEPYKIYKEIDNINLEDLGFKYYEMILFYFQNVLERNLKEGVFSEKLTNSVRKMKLKTNIQKYSNILELIYIEYNKFRECMEFELILKLFNFINILEYDYNYDCISKHFKQLEETGLYEIGKFNIFSPIANILYTFLKKMCLVIPINFVIPEKFKSEDEIKIYDENFLNESENYKYQKENIYLGRYRRRIKEIEEKEIISPVTKEEMNQTENEGEQKYIYFIRPILTFYIKEDDIQLLMKELDHSSHESKTHSLMECIDYYCLYMNLKECNKKTDFHINFHIVEVINNILYFTLNIYLLCVYYVGYNSSDEEYNISVWERKKNTNRKVQIILVVIHILYCVIILILFWVYEVLYTVSNNVSKISNSSFIFNYKELSIEKNDNENNDNTRLRKKIIVENLQYYRKINMGKLELIEEIYNDLSKLKIYSICLGVFAIPNKTISFVFWSLIFDIIYCITDLPIFIVIPLLFVANLISTVKDTLKGLRIRWRSITSTFYFEILILYVLMWLAFLFFPEQFIEEAKTADGENLDDDEPFCNSSFQCFMFFISQGFFDEGTHEMIGTISFRKSHNFFVGMFFYNMISFIVIGVIASNIFTGLISDAFSEFRQKTVERKESMNNQCFICDLSRDDCENGGESFEYHRNKVHNVAKYFYFLCYLYTKNKDDLSPQEKSIWDCILTHDNSWIPHAKN